MSLAEVDDGCSYCDAIVGVGAYGGDVRRPTSIISTIYILTRTSRHPVPVPGEAPALFPLALLCNVKAASHIPVREWRTSERTTLRTT